MSELEYTTVLNTLAVAISQELQEAELAMLATALTQLADTLETVAALRAAAAEWKAQSLEHIALGLVRQF